MAGFIPSIPARRSLAARFGLPYDDNMQDWEWQVADAARFQEFLGAYRHAGLSEAECGSLTEVLIQCVEDLLAAGFRQPPGDSPEWRAVAALLREHPGLHAATVDYWSCLEEPDLALCFHVSALMRPLRIEPPRYDATGLVRVLTPADAASYRAVRLRALEESPPAFGSLPEDEPDLARTAARLAASDDRCFFGAFQGERLVGILRFSRYEAANEKHRAYLGGLFVLPDFRRAGCGRALVREALDRAANLSELRRINLSVVVQQEAAVGLYRSLGFRIYGTEQETFSREGRFYDEHLMTLSLVPDERRGS